jgi:acyl carrier protein
MSTTEEKVKKIIEEKLSVNADQITNDAKFAEDLKADSLDTVELVVVDELSTGQTSRRHRYRVYHSCWSDHG